MKEIISTSNAPQAIGPYSQAIKANNFLFVSGQIPLIPETGNLIQGGIKEQTFQTLTNLKYIIEKAGSSLTDVVKTTVYIKNISDFSQVNEVYATFFDSVPPARVCVEVSNLPKEALVEIDAIVITR